MRISDAFLQPRELYLYRATLHAKPRLLLPACPGATWVSFASCAAAVPTLPKPRLIKEIRKCASLVGPGQLWQPWVWCRSLCPGLRRGAEGMQLGVPVPPHALVPTPCLGAHPTPSCPPYTAVSRRSCSLAASQAESSYSHAPGLLQK